MWMQHSDLITDVLSENIPDTRSNDGYQENSSGYLMQHMACNLADIRRRNDTMLFRNLPYVASVRLGSAVADVEVRHILSQVR